MVSKYIFQLHAMVHKNKFAVNLNAGQACVALAIGAGIQTGAQIAILEGFGQGLAIQSIRPCVVGTAQHLAHIPLGLGVELRAFVRTAVEERLDVTLRIAQQQHRLARQGHRDEVAHLGHLAAMPRKQPSAAEKALLLLRKQGHIGVQIAVHTSVLHQGVHRQVRQCCAHGLGSVHQPNKLGNQVATGGQKNTKASTAKLKPK